MSDGGSDPNSLPTPPSPKSKSASNNKIGALDRFLTNMKTKKKKRLEKKTTEKTDKRKGERRSTDTDKTDVDDDRAQTPPVSGSGKMTSGSGQLEKKKKPPPAGIPSASKELEEEATVFEKLQNVRPAKCRTNIKAKLRWKKPHNSTSIDSKEIVRTPSLKPEAEAKTEQTEKSKVRDTEKSKEVVKEKVKEAVKEKDSGKRKPKEAKQEEVVEAPSRPTSPSGTKSLAATQKSKTIQKSRQDKASGKHKSRIREYSRKGVKVTLPKEDAADAKPKESKEEKPADATREAARQHPEAAPPVVAIAPAPVDQQETPKTETAQDTAEDEEEQEAKREREREALRKERKRLERERRKMLKELNEHNNQITIAIRFLQMVKRSNCMENLLVARFNEKLNDFFGKGMKAEDCTPEILDIIEMGLDKMLDRILFKGDELDMPIDNELRWFVVHRTQAKMALFEVMLNHQDLIPYAWGGTVLNTAKSFGTEHSSDPTAWNLAKQLAEPRAQRYMKKHDPKVPDAESAAQKVAEGKESSTAKSGKDTEDGKAAGNGSSANDAKNAEAEKEKKPEKASPASGQKGSQSSGKSNKTDKGSPTVSCYMPAFK